MRQFNLITYEIDGECCHCTVKVYIAGRYSFTLDTGTKYSDSAKEEIEQVFGRVLKKLLKDNIKDSDYISVMEDEEE
jgi:hypothetical protein